MKKAFVFCCGMVLSVLAEGAGSCVQIGDDVRVGGLYRSQLHRGGGKARPDNTLEACLWCWGQGVAPEADARFTKDCVAIAFHDEDLKRVTRGLDKDLAERKLSDLTWPEIRDLDVGSYLGPEHSSVRISTMESIFAAMKGRPERYLYLDEKGAPPTVMAQMARQFGVERQVCYTSPDYFKVREWSRNVPNGETMVWIGGGWHPEMTDEAVGVMNESLNRKLMVMATNDFEGVSQVQLHVFVDVNRTDDWFAPSSERLADAIARLHAKGIRVQAGVWGRYSDRADVFDKVWDLGFDSFATDNSYEYLAWHRAKMTSRLQGPIDRTGSPDALPMTFDGTAGQDGGEWLDDRGVHINAHGGGVIWHEGRYYWYGEHKGSGLNGNVAHGAAVHCYSSEDLAQWKDEGVCLMTSTNAWHDLADGCIIERPKVAYCRKTGKFVMYFHLELKTEPQNYDSALVGIAVNDSPTDCFTYIGCRRPNAGVWPKGVETSEMTYRTLAEACEVANCKDGGVNNRISVSSYPFAATFWRGQLSRDQALFVDDDGRAYHIYASEHNSTLHISELTDDFIGETGRYWRLGVKDWTEAPAICKHDGWYYILGSGCTGWKPNAARYYRSRSIAGPWERMGNPCRGTDEVTGLGADMTWGCQSTCIFPVRGRTDSVIAMFDRWSPENAMDGRYVWREVGFTDDGRMTIPWKKDDGVTEP